MVIRALERRDAVMLLCRASDHTARQQTFVNRLLAFFFQMRSASPAFGRLRSAQKSLLGQYDELLPLRMPDASAAGATLAAAAVGE